MLKFYSILIGEDPAYTANFHPSSKRKIAKYAACLMIPVIIWFINGFLLVSHVLEGGIMSALLTATVIALLIYFVEKVVIMAKGNKKLGYFRLMIGFFIALLGSVIMDEVVFKNDIDNKIGEYKQIISEQAKADVESGNQTLIMQQIEIVNQKYDTWKISLEDAIGEADGTKGSRRAFVGDIANLKMEVAGKHEKAYLKENAKLEALQENLDQKKEEAAVLAKAAFNENGLLLRIKALFDLVREDIYMAIIYCVFTLILFFMEFMVVLAKLWSDKSIDEEIEEASIKLIQAKTQMTLQRSIQYFEPELTDERVKLARLALTQGVKGNLASYN